MARVGLFQIKGWEADYLKSKLEAAGFEVDIFETEVEKSEISDFSKYQAISVFVGSSINKEVIDKFSNLKLITTRSTGFDHIDLNYARSKNIALGYVPNYGENTVAEFAMGLILTLSRKLYLGIDRIKEGGEFSFEGLEGFDLKGKTLGVVGAGRIGRHVIKMAKGFDMRVIAYDRNPKPELAQELGFEYVSYDDLLKESDIITFHVFYAPETHHMFNKNCLEKVKKGVIIINTARGPVIETEALVLGLQKGIIGGAGLDVLEEEGVLKDEQGFWMRSLEEESLKTNLRVLLENHLLFRMPNVVVTPHNAFNTREAKMRILDTDFANISSFFEKGMVQFPIP
ncbi:MAG: lactate dehydrogenase [Candidatus Parcubacteria bacterium]|nr:hydroxyacid dehydrogenase [Patescibacteria group bacterium]BCX15938.1 MAG: lactate dehydrogenase [Candidatus Parcubacteria bacterium]